MVYQAARAQGEPNGSGCHGSFLTTGPLRHTPPNNALQLTAYSLVSLRGDVGESPSRSYPDAIDRLSLGSLETGAERGSSRPGLPEPGQLFGAIEPVFARSGKQECV